MNEYNFFLEDDGLDLDSGDEEDGRDDEVQGQSFQGQSFARDASIPVDREENSGIRQPSLPSHFFVAVMFLSSC